MGDSWTGCHRVGVLDNLMKTNLTPIAAFILAALWGCLMIWGFALGNVAFSIGGIFLAITFTFIGTARARQERKRS